MSNYVNDSIKKGQQSETATNNTLVSQSGRKTEADHLELKHGEWIARARAQLKINRLQTPIFGFLIIFMLLFAGSVFLFEKIDILTGALYAIKTILTTLFAVTLGFLLSIWWSTSARAEEKIKEAERIDVEFRELLMSFSDSLFDIINALNTLTSKPPRAFVIATDFLLGEYVHLLQSRLQRYGDYIAGLGLDATDFLDEKVRIFEGIRERASLAIRGMPEELETLFVGSLNLDFHKLVDTSAERQRNLREKLNELVKSDASDSSIDRSTS